MNHRLEKLKTIVIIAILTLNIFNISKIDRLEMNIQNLSSQIYSMDDSINTVSSNIISDITNALEKENSIISDFKYDFNSFKDGKMSLNLKVLPKEYSPEATYYFSYLLKDGTTDYVKADIDDGNYIVADINAPFKDGIEINYIEEVGSKRKIEKLDSIDTIEELIEPFSLEEGPSTMTFGATTDDRVLDNIYMISYDFGYNSFEDDEGIETAQVYLSLDGDIIDSFPMSKKKDISTPSREVYEYHFKDYKLDFKEEDMIQVYAIATHSKGYQVKLFLGNIYINMDHEFEDNGQHPEPWEEMVTLIYED